MDMVFRIIFAPLQPFIGHPERAIFVAVAFAIVLAASIARCRTLLRRHLVILSASVAWLLFSIEEQIAVANGWNIRVDLLVIAPLLLLISLAAIWAIVRGLRSPPGQIPAS